MSEGKSDRNFPPLQISDLIVLTLSVAFTMASIAPNYQDALRRQEIKAWDVLPDLFGYLSIGICLFGLIVLARQRWRGEAYPLTPGHRLLLIVGPYSVMALMALWIRPLLFAHANDSWRVIHSIDNLLFILLLVVSIVLSLPAMRTLEWRWRLCFASIFLWLISIALWLAIDGVRIFGYLQSSPWRQHLIAISCTFEILAAAVAVVICVADATKRVRSDWLHYFGIAALALGAVEVSFTWGEFSVRWWRDLFYYWLP